MTDDILAFTIQSIAGLLGLVCLLRFLLSPYRETMFGPTYAIFHKLSNWLVRPFGKFFPVVGGYESAPFFVAWLVYSVERLAVMAIHGISLEEDIQLLASAALIFGMSQILEIIVYIHIAIIIIHVLYSWINPGAPMAFIFRAFADRILSVFRRFIPPIGSVDITPVAALFIAQIVLIMINHLERHIAAAL